MHRRTHRTADLLSRTDLLRGVPWRDLVLLGTQVEEIDAAPGRRLVREGDRLAQECFLVIDGSLAVDHAGDPLAELAAGGVGGEMALLDRAPRRASLVTRERSRLLVVNRSGFSLLLRHPAVRARLRALYLARGGGPA